VLCNPRPDAKAIQSYPLRPLANHATQRTGAPDTAGLGFIYVRGDNRCQPEYKSRAGLYAIRETKRVGASSVMNLTVPLHHGGLCIPAHKIKDREESAVTIQPPVNDPRIIAAKSLEPRYRIPTRTEDGVRQIGF
jgi:hypothetical protein